ncbi:MAG: cytochrome b N-terminal domain-containing protein [Acidobacteriota bacterium]|nr:cytochrome b N-terminal domain-containing protein [Acidobacteriota bacterium]
MASRGNGVLDWLDSRTGYRNGLKHLLDEPLPSGTGWWFTLGSVLVGLLSIQFLTGAVLMMYYVPTPAYAWDSVHYIMTGLAFGHVLRDLHFFGASFIVIAAGLHMLRVIFFGSYKKPREVTWLSGVFLLLLILAFALTGYLLPWDQRAYWATVVTTNIAKTAPVLGPYVSRLMKGGPDVGALTLSRWYAMHVILLPAGLVTFIVLHLYLMRRHGISGPVKARPGKPHPFYPDHVVKDTLLVALVFAGLLSFAVLGHAPLAAKANPADASYVPRPEWYFLSLFQLLHYFKGGLEPVATIGIPTLLVLVLLALPWLDRKHDRDPRKRPAVIGITVLILAGVALLTTIGLKESPPEPDPTIWSPAAVAGLSIAQSAACTTCHAPGGAAAVLGTERIQHDDSWIEGHMSDPQMIAPGLRPRPADALNVLQTRAVVAYVDKLRLDLTPPQLSDEQRAAEVTIGTRCMGCHEIQGEGTSSNGAPDLTHIGAKRDAAWLDKWITDPGSVDENATMPSFGGILTADQIKAVADYLATLK